MAKVTIRGLRNSYSENIAGFRFLHEIQTSLYGEASFEAVAGAEEAMEHGCLSNPEVLISTEDATTGACKTVCIIPIGTRRLGTAVAEEETFSYCYTVACIDYENITPQALMEKLV